MKRRSPSDEWCVALLRLERAERTARRLPQVFPPDGELRPLEVDDPTVRGRRDNPSARARWVPKDRLESPRHGVGENSVGNGASESFTRRRTVGAACDVAYGS
jgi:hypothetical protein